MRSAFARGLVAAMENDEVAVPADALTEDVGAGAESLETELAEVVSEQAEGDAAQAATDEAAETVEALESLILSLESAVQNGGLDKSGAAVLNIGLESMYQRVGLVPTRKAPALESYGGASSRQGATQLALEGIKEQAKRIWDAIKAAIKKAVDWVMGFWNKFFGAAEKLKKRADALHEKAEKTTGKAKESTFEDERLVKALYVGTAVKADGTSAEAVVATAKELFKERNNSVKAGENLLKIMGDLSKDQYEANIGSTVSGMLYANGLSKTTGADFAGGDGVDVFLGNELPGGRAIVTYSPTSPEHIGKARSELGQHNPKGKAPSGTKVTTLATAAAVKIAENVGFLAEELLAFRQASGAGKDLLSKWNAEIPKLEKEATDAADETVKKNLKLAQKLFSAAPKLIEQPYIGFSTYAVTTGKALLDYVELSLKQYSAE